MEIMSGPWRILELGNSCAGKAFRRLPNLIAPTKTNIPTAAAMSGSMGSPCTISRPDNSDQNHSNMCLWQRYAMRWTGIVASDRGGLHGHRGIGISICTGAQQHSSRRYSAGRSMATIFSSTSTLASWMLIQSWVGAFASPFTRFTPYSRYGQAPLFTKLTLPLNLNLSQCGIFQYFMHMRAKSICELLIFCWNDRSLV